MEQLNNEYSSDRHVMVDIETLSTKTNAVITQIAMVRFNPLSGETFDELNLLIDIQTSLDLGLEVDANTLHFWFNQTKTAQDIGLGLSRRDDSVSIVKAITHINEFFGDMTEPHEIRMWGKGTSFDLSKIQNVYEKLGYSSTPWKYWLERCVRTAIADVDSANKLEFCGVKHNALDDCKHQIKQVNHALKIKYGKK